MENKKGKPVDGPDARNPIHGKRMNGGSNAGDATAQASYLKASGTNRKGASA